MFKELEDNKNDNKRNIENPRKNQINERKGVKNVRTSQMSFHNMISFYYAVPIVAYKNVSSLMIQ